MKPAKTIQLHFNSQCHYIYSVPLIINRVQFRESCTRLWLCNMLLTLTPLYEAVIWKSPQCGRNIKRPFITMISPMIRSKTSVSYKIRGEWGAAQLLYSVIFSRHNSQYINSVSLPWHHYPWIALASSIQLPEEVQSRIRRARITRAGLFVMDIPDANLKPQL